MKIRNIHIKLFISFLFILIAMQVYFFINMNVSAEHRIHPERNKNRVIKIHMLKDMIEEKISLNNGFDQSLAELQEIISRVSKLYDAKIWIEDSKGASVLESFQPADRPAKITTGFDFKKNFDDVTISHVLGSNTKTIYTDVPFDAVSDEGFSLHILYEGSDERFISQFTYGLAGIILIMAVLTLSLLQFIRIKVNRFRKSVLRIADGDLSHRIEAHGRGVVEDLSRAFNSMTDKLEKMITSSKEITANVSHEIRTPLGRIRVVEDLLRKKLDLEGLSEYKRHLDNIREDIQILDDLTGRLLEFIKLDSYESTSKYEQFDPSELMNDLLIRFEPVIEYKGLSVRRDIFFSSPITGDKSALTSAFLNILDNAFKYTPEHGNIRIKIQSEQGFFETSITNSFRKLDQKDLGNIFKPFERFQQSDNGGSGLGLAITKKIVEKHGGDIIALNSIEGFELRVRIPL